MKHTYTTPDQRLAELGAMPSIGSIGDSYDTQSSSGVADVVAV